MYHRILARGDMASGNPSLISGEPVEFDRQLRHLARWYRVVSAGEVIEAYADGRPLPERAVLITFDDAYRDFGEVAWPILRKYGFPATVFVATAYPDHPERRFWWDRLYGAVFTTRAKSICVAGCGLLYLDTVEARLRTLRRTQQIVKRLPHEDAMRLVNHLCEELGGAGDEEGCVLSWRELRSLAAEGVTIGGHTRTHPALDRLTPATVRDEVRGCREDLTRALGTRPFAFAYPFGAHDEAAVEAVREAGFALAFTCLDGHARVGTTDPLRLPRTNITARTSSFLFRVRLLRLGAYVDAWRNGAVRREARNAASA